jgi:hypothetical protein
MPARPAKAASPARRFASAQRVASSWLRSKRLAAEQAHLHRIQAVAGLVVLGVVLAGEITLIVKAGYIDTSPLPLSAQQFLHFTFGR